MRLAIWSPTAENGELNVEQQKMVSFVLFSYRPSRWVPHHVYLILFVDQHAPKSSTQWGLQYTNALSSSSVHHWSCQQRTEANHSGTPEAKSIWVLLRVGRSLLKNNLLHIMLILLDSTTVPPTSKARVMAPKWCNQTASWGCEMGHPWAMAPANLGDSARWIRSGARLAYESKVKPDLQPLSDMIYRLSTGIYGEIHLHAKTRMATW